MVAKLRENKSASEKFITHGFLYPSVFPDHFTCIYSPEFHVSLPAGACSHVGNMIHMHEPCKQSQQLSKRNLSLSVLLQLFMYDISFTHASVLSTVVPLGAQRLTRSGVNGLSEKDF